MRSMRTTCVACLIVLLAMPSRAAEPEAGATPALGREIDQLVSELLSTERAKLKLQTAGNRLAFEGMAWESTPGTRGGTSRLGLQLDRAVGEALSRKRIAPVDPSVPTRGIAGAVLQGAFGIVGKTARVALSMVDMNSGRVLAEVKRTLSPDALVNLGRTELLPPDSENAKFLAQMVGDALGHGAQPFALHVRTARGAHAAYFEGEHLQALVDVERDCHLRLYHVSWAERTLTLVFPNRSEPSSFVHAGASLHIPAQGSAAVFEVAKPYGVDAIVAVASEQPFEDEASVAARLAANTGGAESASPSETTAAPADSSAFLSEQGVDEQKTRGVLTRGLMVRHRDDVSPNSDPDRTAGTDSDGAGAAGSDIAKFTAGQGGKPKVARAVCFFTTLPRMPFGR